MKRGEWEQHGEAKFRVTDLEASSTQYGPCEVCGKHATEMFIQSGERLTEDYGGQFPVMTENLFGHEQCLRGQRDTLAAGERVRSASA